MEGFGKYPYSIVDSFNLLLAEMERANKLEVLKKNEEFNFNHINEFGKQLEIEVPLQKPQIIENNRFINKTEKNTSVIDLATEKLFKFCYDCQEYSLKLSIPSNYSNHLINENRNYVYTGKKLPTNWQIDYYKIFINNNFSNNLINSLILALEKISMEHHLSFVEIAVAFVQGAISYDDNKLKQESRQKRFPIETLDLKFGVCEDTSILLAKIFELSGYDFLFVEFPKANHLGIAVKVENDKRGIRFLKNTYTYIETTSYNAIGIMPKIMAGNVKLDKSPLLFRTTNNINNFEEFYRFVNIRDKKCEQFGENYYQLDCQAQILTKKMKELEHWIELERKVISKNPINENIALFNLKVNEYNQLNSKLNELNLQMR